LKLLGGLRENVNKDEPQFTPGRPECPEHVTGIARKKWTELCDVLERGGVLAVATGADQPKGHDDFPWGFQE
jgi:phage terminase small subunit